MTCTHLTVDFLASGDVEYRLHSHLGETPLHVYLIEWPFDRVGLLNEARLDREGCQRSVTAEGFVLLEWDLATGPEARTIHYVKRGSLTRPALETPVWRYQERFRVEPDLSLWLHGPRRSLSAIRARSTAVFQSGDGNETAYLPRELSEEGLHEPGVLTVDWRLEPC